MNRREFFGRVGGALLAAGAISAGSIITHDEVPKIVGNGYVLICSGGPQAHLFNQQHPSQVAFLSDPRPRRLWEGGR